MLDKIEPKHLEGEPKVIGKMGDAKLYQLKTKGGLYIIVKNKAKGYEFLSCGPHRQVARQSLVNKYDNIEFTELSKADHVPPEHYAMLLPEYEALTVKFRKANGDEE